MKIYLARHGNTFGPDDKVIWVGGANDLPLVEKGKQQAKDCANAFISSGVTIEAIFSGSLLRTSEFAEIIRKSLGLEFKPIEDLRFNEINYGRWDGKTSEGIEEEFGWEALDAWNKRSIWPTDCDWQGNEELVKQNINEFLSEISEKFSEDDSILIVSSSGKLRYFLTLIPGEFDKRIKEQTFKMKTGNLSRIDYSLEDKKVILDFWNIAPESLTAEP